MNLANNSRLDGDGFTPFGIICAAEMASTVNTLYSGYGELNQTNLCPDPSAKLCNGPKLERILSDGNAYLAKDFPLMSFVHKAELVAKHDGLLN